MPKTVRLPLPASYIRCLARGCDKGARCARHATIGRDAFDGRSTVKQRVCSPEEQSFFLPLTDPELSA
jgi:hypothetical protein